MVVSVSASASSRSTTDVVEGLHPGRCGRRAGVNDPEKYNRHLPSCLCSWTEATAVHT